MANNRSQKPGCLLTFLGLFGQGEPAEDSLPYRTQDDFLSKAELSFHHVLSSILKERAVICPKVRLGDIFSVGKAKKWMSFVNRIASKHIDFLICDPKTMKPLTAIELDDSSHRRSDREERDKFVDRVFATAALPLVHIKAQRQYNAKDLATQLLPLLNMRGNPSVEAVSALQQASIRWANTARSAPSCPRCGVEMVLRTAKGGANRGKQFYGCPNYPKCREIAPTE